MERDLSELVETTLENTQQVKGPAQWLHDLSIKLFLDSPFQPIKTFLNGTWLEHPLHPLLTDVPVGAWTAAMLLDAVEMTTGADVGEATGIATGLGALAGSAAIVTGLMDFTDTDPPEQTVAFTHGIINITATLLFSLSFFLRWRDKWRTSWLHVMLSGLGYLVVTVGAYLGGSLVFRNGVMVNRNAYRQGPKDYTPAMPLADLVENKPRRIDVNNQPILLVRQGERVYAVGAICSHYGGPLDKGKLGDCTIECPWHYSVYSLEDGRYLKGPTTSPIPAYDVRIDNGIIQLKQRK